MDTEPSTTNAGDIYIKEEPLDSFDEEERAALENGVSVKSEILDEMCDGKIIISPTAVYIKTEEIDHNYEEGSPTMQSMEQCIEIVNNPLEIKEEYKELLSATINRPFSCDTCEYQVARKDKLIRHMKIHTGEKPYQCDDCIYRTAYKDKLLSHRRIHTGEKPYVCSVCDYRAAFKTNFINHMNLHNKRKFNHEMIDLGNDNQILDQVENTSSVINFCETLSEHKKIGEKTFTCSMCAYYSLDMLNLFNHMKIHTGEKPFKCEKCDFRSAFKFNLINHLMLHNKENKFECSICEYRTEVKSQLLKHLKAHTSERTYICSICYNRFKRKVDLLRHIKRISCFKNC